MRRLREIAEEGPAENPGTLTELPTEILSLIIQHLDKQDIKRLSMTCSALYDVVATQYFQTLHATSLRFLSLQRRHLAALEEKFQQHQNSYTVSLRRPWNASAIGMLQLARVTISLATAAAILYKYGYKKMADTPKNHIVYFILIAAAIALVTFYTYYYHIAPDQTAQLRAQLFNNRDEARLKRFCVQLADLLPCENLLTQFLSTYSRRPPAERTVGSSLIVGKNQLNQFTAYIAELEKLTQSIRLKNVSAIPISQFSPDLRPYLTHSATFWNKNRIADLTLWHNNRGADLIKLDSDDGLVNESSDIRRPS